MGHAITVNVWRCDHCGKEEAWGPNWRSRLILHKSGGPGPWDEELVACSTECATAIAEKRKWRKLPDKSKGAPAVEISGGQLQPMPNTEAQRAAVGGPTGAPSCASPPPEGDKTERPQHGNDTEI